MRLCCFAFSLVGVVLILAVGSGFVFGSGPVVGDAASPAADWIVDIVDATREVGYTVSVAVDPETGHTYISYYEGNDGDLWLARTGAPVGNCGPNNTWKCQVIDVSLVVGKNSSIAVGGPGPVAKLYISYYDVTNGSLRVFEGTVDRSTGVLVGSDSIVDQGNPAGGLLVGQGTSIVVDDSGNPHVGYRVVDGLNQTIRYATKAAPGTGNCGLSGSWNCSAIDYASGGDSINIELDPNGVPNIAFNDVPGGFESHLVVAEYVGSGGDCDASTQWRCDYLFRLGFDIGGYVSLAIGTDGVKHLAYRNATTDWLEWARYVGANGNCGNGAAGDAWHCISIEPLGPGGSPAGIDLQIDNDGHPLIAYQDTDLGYGDLKIARPLEATPWVPAGNCGPLSPTFFRTWLCETLDVGDQQNSNAHGGLSMAMTSQGEAVVAYRTLFDPPSGPSYGYLKVAMDPGIVFHDGFETGNTTAWSATVSLP